MHTVMNSLPVCELHLVMGIIPARIEEIRSARGIVLTEVPIPKIAMNESGLNLSVSLFELVQKPRNNDLDYGYDSGVEIVPETVRQTVVMIKLEQYLSEEMGP